MGEGGWDDFLRNNDDECTDVKSFFELEEGKTMTLYSLDGNRPRVQRKACVTTPRQQAHSVAQLAPVCRSGQKYVQACTPP